VDFTLQISSASLLAAEFTVFDCSLLVVNSRRSVRFREKNENYSCSFNCTVKYTMVSNENVRINGAENRRLSIK
jgi:hypothetical protein